MGRRSGRDSPCFVGLQRVSSVIPLEDVDEACRGIIAAISSSEYFHLYGLKIEALHFKSEALNRTGGATHEQVQALNDLLAVTESVISKSGINYYYNF